MLAGAHKKFYRTKHLEIYLLDRKVQYKHEMKLPLDMVSKHVVLYLCLPDYVLYRLFHSSSLRGIFILLERGFRFTGYSQINTCTNITLCFLILYLENPPTGCDFAT